MLARVRACAGSCRDLCRDSVLCGVLCFALLYFAVLRFAFVACPCPVRVRAVLFRVRAGFSVSGCFRVRAGLFRVRAGFFRVRVFPCPVRVRSVSGPCPVRVRSVSGPVSGHGPYLLNFKANPAYGFEYNWVNPAGLTQHSLTQPNVCNQLLLGSAL